MHLNEELKFKGKDIESTRKMLFLINFSVLFLLLKFKEEEKAEKTLKI